MGIYGADVTIDGCEIKKLEPRNLPLEYFYSNGKTPRDDDEKKLAIELKKATKEKNKFLYEFTVEEHREVFKRAGVTFLENPQEL